MPHTSPPHRGLRVSNAEFARLYADRSLTLAQIGKMLNISQNAVTMRAISRGLKARGNAKTHLARDVADADFADMWLLRVRIDQMQRHYGCGRHVIKQTARRLGLPMVSRRGYGLTIDIADFPAARLAARMKAAAAAEQAALINAEMADTIGYRLCGAIHATRATVDIVGARP